MEEGQDECKRVQGRKIDRKEIRKLLDVNTLCPWDSHHRTFDTRARLADHDFSLGTRRVKVHDDVEEGGAAHGRVSSEIFLPPDRLRRIVNVGEDLLAQQSRCGVPAVNAAVNEVVDDFLDTIKADR